MSNFVDNANATALMGAVEESIANTRIFPGTLDEYDALTPEEKAKYKYIATPDQEVVTKNNLEAEIADIVNVYGAKNLIPYPYHRQNGYTTNGATFTYDDEGVITVNKVVGNSTAYFALFSNILYPNAEKFLKPNTSYILSMELENATDTSCFVQAQNGSDIAAIRNKATGKYEISFTTTETIDSLTVGLYYGAEKTENNAKVKLMIRLASIQDDTWVPYVPTNKELTDNLKVKTIELTNQTTSSDGKLILTGMGHKMAIVSSRLLDDSNNHLIVPFGFCYSSNGDALFVLVDNSTNAIITSSITLSGTMEYIDLS